MPMIEIDMSNLTNGGRIPAGYNPMIGDMRLYEGKAADGRSARVVWSAHTGVAGVWLGDAGRDDAIWVEGAKSPSAALKMVA